MNHPTLKLTDQGGRIPPQWNVRCRIKGGLHPTMRQHSAIHAGVMDSQKEGTSILTLTLLWPYHCSEHPSTECLRKQPRHNYQQRSGNSKHKHLALRVYMTFKYRASLLFSFVQQLSYLISHLNNVCIGSGMSAQGQECLHRFTMFFQHLKNMPDSIRAP